MNSDEKRKAATDDASGYLATIESLEPDIHPIDASAFYASAAISLKRIADRIDKQATVDETLEAITIIDDGPYVKGAEIINELSKAGFKVVRR